MSPRRFAGWEPAEYHLYSYDDPDRPDRVTSVTVTRESEWDDKAQEWALTHGAYKAGLCPRCNTHHTRSHDHTVVRDVLRDEDICQDCKAIKTTRDEYHKRHTDESCDCDDQHFYVAEYLTFAEATRRRAAENPQS